MQQKNKKLKIKPILYNYRNEIMKLCTNLLVLLVDLCELLELLLEDVLALPDELGQVRVLVTAHPKG